MPAHDFLELFLDALRSQLGFAEGQPLGFGSRISDFGAGGEALPSPKDREAQSAALLDRATEAFVAPLLYAEAMRTATPQPAPGDPTRADTGRNPKSEIRNRMVLAALQGL